MRHRQMLAGTFVAKAEGASLQPCLGERVCWLAARIDPPCQQEHGFRVSSKSEMPQDRFTETGATAVQDHARAIVEPALSFFLHRLIVSRNIVFDKSARMPSASPLRLGCHFALSRNRPHRI